MSQWIETLVGGETFKLLNLDHRATEERIMDEMQNGVAVFYDRRWDATEVLTDWLGENLSLIKNKRILVLGAGVGMETVLLAKHAEHIWINDLAPVALELCQEQLAQNGLTNATSLCGRYEELELPEVDLVVASFLVYDKETRTAMQRYLREILQKEKAFILMNEMLPPFKSLLNEEAHEILFEKEGAFCVQFGD